MHPNPRRVIPILLVLAALGALGYWYFVLRTEQDRGVLLSASGTIEITQVLVAAEVGGRVQEIRFAEGEQVNAGDVLLQIDDSLLQAQRRQAEASLAAARANADAAQSNVEAARFAQEAAQANVAAARANLELLEAGASAAQLAAAQAQLDQAQANQRTAVASLAALTAGARPEEVNAARLRLDQARQAYDNMIVVLSSEQITDVTSARTTALENLEAANNRLSELKMDSAMPAAALEAAEAAVNDCRQVDETAQAALTAVTTSGLPFYRQLEAARQLLDAAELSLSQAQARQALINSLSDLPQAALDAARSDSEAAQKLVDEARAAYNSLNISPQGNRLRAAWSEVQRALNALNQLGRGGAAPLESVLNQRDAASAQSELAAANLNALQSGTRQEQVSAAQAQLDAARSQFEAAQARTQAAQAQAAAAQAQVDLAQAALDILDVQIARLTITAPLDGVVLTRLIQPGEIAAPGATLFILGQTDEKTITVYIPEDRYGELSLGQEAEVSVDSFPGMRFDAVLIQIADQAEFTPRNVQTAQGRRNTVFAVKLSVADPQDRLKPGMPADVTFK